MVVTGSLLKVSCLSPMQRVMAPWMGDAPHQSIANSPGDGHRSLKRTVTWIWLVATLIGSQFAVTVPANAADLPDIVLVLTDDQRAGTLSRMPQLKRRIIIGGVAASEWLLPDFGWRSVFVFGATVTAALIPVVMLLMPEKTRSLGCARHSSVAGQPSESGVHFETSAIMICSRCPPA